MSRDNSSARRWEYHDFELEIREGGPREYPVIVRSPEGRVEAQEEMRFPFDKQERDDKLKELSNAVRLSSVGRRRIRLPEAQTVQDFGQALFEALLRGQVGDHFDKSLREARRQNKGLRLKLRIQPPELASVPWEFLYDPGRNAYLCLSSMTPLVRYPEMREPVEQLPVTLPLKILGMVASPDDLPGLQVEKEKRETRKALRDLEREGRVELKWLEGQTPRDLLRAMSRGTWHVFHFIGHGDFDLASDEGRIVLADDECYARYLRAEDLAHLLKDHWDLRLVLLNSCEGARGSEHDAFSSTAATLVRPGIPAVLANQYEITNNAATEFSRAFYEALTDGLPVDAAVARARTSLKIEFDNTLEWGTPVLYMRSPDGRIFDIEPAQTTRDREDEDLLRRYREGVESAWADGELHGREVEWLRDLANNKLGLSPSTAADIEREVMGGTKETILERPSRDREEEERQKQLDELYAQARRSHHAQEWQAVVDVFDQIHVLNPDYPDPEGLLGSAREELAALEHEQTVVALYDQGRRHVEADEWEQALECFEEVQRLEPGYRKTERLLSRVRGELAKPPTVKVPDLSGQDASQASSTLAEAGLKLGDQDEAPNGDVPDGDFVGQEPVAGTKAERGSLVSITVSSGPEEEVSTTIPDISSTSPVIVGSRTEEKQRVGSEGSSRRMAQGTTVRSGKRTKLMIGIGLLCAVVAVVLIVALAYSLTGEDATGETEPGMTIFTLTRTLTGHSDYVRSIAFSFAEGLMASGSDDGTVKLWDPWSGEELRTLDGHSSSVTSVAFSPDGSLLASGSNDDTVKLWDPWSGEELRTLTGNSNNVRSVAFSPDGSLLANGGDGSTVRLWDPQSGELLRTLTDAGIPVAFNSDGSLMASGGGESDAKLWDPRSGELLRTLDGHSSSVISVAFSPNGSLLASGSNDDTVKLWDPQSGEELRTLTGGGANDFISFPIAFGPDGSLLVSGGDDGTVKLWGSQSGELHQTLTGRSNAVISVAFSPDGSLLASGSDDGTVEIWEKTEDE